ncbi:recombinase family protein [Ktedonospora formicarum]|uniref:Recombinase family protein n=1 Tax=Ktedonospora formicarum TaxID=2778364 RepID=A0A8J3MRN6_9CHLR|nr:recombinase family protein [Ktedonospora formicarum]GHO45205.1 hypothetical protein KSX_33680 [Ktedonospora formicarum]
MTQYELPDLTQTSPVYAIGYARISGDKQKDGASLETQTAAMRRYCAERGWVLLDVAQEVYSGYYLMERKVLSEQVRTVVRERQAHVVIVNSFDRLSRDQTHSAVLYHEMMENGVHLVSVTEELDNSPFGTFLRQAISFAAELERQKIIERAARGTQNRVDKGEMIGAGVPKYGYSWGENNKCYVINEDEAKIVREIFERYVTHGQSLRAIAKWLNEEKIPTRHMRRGKTDESGSWFASTLRNMIASEEYRGIGYNRTLKWVRVDGRRKRTEHPNPTLLPDGVVPRLISDDMWYAAQAKRAVAKVESPRNNREPEECLLRGGFIICGYCNRVMQVARARNYYDKSRGRTKHRKAQYVCNSGGELPGRCSRRASMMIDFIDNEVWVAVKELLENLDRVREVLTAPVVNGVAAHLLSVESQIADTKAEIARRVQDMAGFTGYARELTVAEINRLEKQLKDLDGMRLQAIPEAKQEESVQRDIEAFLSWCLTFKGNYDAATYEERRRALRHLGVRVLVYQESDPDRPRYKITGKPELFARLHLKKEETDGKQATDSVHTSSQIATRYPLPTSRAM